MNWSVLELLQRAAVDLEDFKQLSLDWEELESPESLLLPTVAWKFGQDAPKNLKGLVRYGWCRYQLLLLRARQVAELTEQPTLLMDDLLLAKAFYPHPGSRVVHGIDLLVSPEGQDELRRSLQSRGWSLEPWRPEAFCELRSADDIRVRLSVQWLPDCRLPSPIDSREQGRVLKYLTAEEQLYRSCWCDKDPLAVVDVHQILTTIVGREMSPHPLLTPALAEVESHLRRLGLEPEFPPPSRPNLALSVLRRTFRLKTRTAVFLHELATEILLADGQGWPKEWWRELCRRWGISSPFELPFELWRRYRSDL